MAERVLYVYDGKMTRTGIDAVVWRELQALAGSPVDLVARGDAGVPGVERHGSRFTAANLISWLPRKFYYPAQKRLLALRGARLVRRRDYRCVISWPQRALASFREAQSKGIPCFLNHDTTHFRRSMRAERVLRWPEYSRSELCEEYDLATKILVPSEFSRDGFLAEGVNPEKLVVIGRGVDLGVFRPLAAQPARPFRVIFCGRVCERKGIREILAAWRLAALADSELWIAGSVAKEVEDLVAQPQGPNIRFLGHQSDLAALMQTCDAQILLSRNEGQAKGLLEGAACGLATLATVNCGFPLAEAVNGFQVVREEVAQVAERLHFLWANRATCREMGLAGRREIELNYSWESFAGRFRQAVECASPLAL